MMKNVIWKNRLESRRISPKYSSIIFLLIMITWTPSQASANPVNSATKSESDIAKKHFDEVGDLNDNLQSDKENTNNTDLPFSHRDEVQEKEGIILNADNILKYDVEIIESRDIKKENLEIEERFKGPALEMNTNTFVSENIELNSGTVDYSAMKDSHVVLTVILVLVALVSISLYVFLVIWRSHLEERYGMRELLVVNTDEDVYQSSNMACNTSTIDENISNIRHLTFIRT
ncbi:uncharacterized protein LOC119685581 [Teleopsis dalmanni]|uniref:uncharacterized protein LOC119685581 n=1 Tax=Teleopsis dalmanni TaxID=139649 RepID=UPI0018CD8133|nr:uncharacterized protein LOC119685581 [Teleopsis dalmanni]